MLYIRKGQYFIGQNNKMYTFLGYKNSNIIYCLDNDFENTGEILMFDVDFIESPLDEFNIKSNNINWYYQCREELENANLTDKLDMLIINMKNDFNTWEKEVDFLNLDIQIKEIGSLVKGKAYFSDQNQYYEVIGFIVDTETYKKNKKIEENKGLFSIYHSKCDNLAPMTFFYSDKNDKTRFYNEGTNDYFLVEEVLIEKSDINKYITEHNYNVPKLENLKEMKMSR